ncbi:hypothetical protein [Caulobacter sp. LARHSG274]
MPKFKVTFAKDTTFDDMGEGLRWIPDRDSNVVQKDAYWIIKVQWGTDRQSLNNLKGRIERYSGAKCEVEVSDDRTAEIPRRAHVNLVRAHNREAPIAYNQPRKNRRNTLDGFIVYPDDYNSSDDENDYVP